MKKKDFIRLLELGEGRHIEFKSSNSFKDISFKIKIVKSMLALSNVQTGGRIIIGVKEHKKEHKNVYIPNGITIKDAKTYIKDEFTQSINSYADPYIEFDFEFFKYNKKNFLEINVHEFKEIPVICKKENTQEKLIKGAIYTRSRGKKAESIPVPSQNEMREIIELAIRKGVKKQREFLKYLFMDYKFDSAKIIKTKELRNNDQIFFEKQVKDLKST